MIIAINNLHELPYPIQEALVDLSEDVQAGWNIEHYGKGGHADVTVRTLGVQTDSILSPQQITLATNNYNPPGLEMATVLRLKTDASRNITGLQMPSPDRNRWIHLVNIGAQSIVLVHGSTSSTVGNRFAGPNAADVTVRQQGSVWLWRDPLSAVWRIQGA